MIKNKFTLLILICLIIVFTNHNILAIELPDSTKGTISTTGTASESYPPDTAEIILAIETTESTVSQSTDKNNIISEKVINALNGVIDKSKGDLIKTSSYSVQPKYEYDNKRKNNNLVGYLVANQVTVKTGKINDIGKFIDRAIEQGANRVHNIYFTIADDGNYCEQLLDKATKRGKFEAEVVARSLGTSITGINSVTSSCSSFDKPPIYQKGFAMEAAASRSAASIEPGSMKLVGSVNLVFFIDNSN